MTGPKNAVGETTWGGLACDEGCRALVDLAEAYALDANVEGFQEELRGFVADHKRRKALMHSRFPLCPVEFFAPLQGSAVP
jgi:hypothetical protein